MQPANLIWRALAAVFDGLLFGVILGIISGFASAAGSDAPERLGDPQDFAGSLFILAGYSAYYLLFEWLMGTSPGKRTFRLWVVTRDGQKIDGSAAFMRNVIRPVDALFFYLVGILSALLSPSRQRLGDRVAGTIVVRRPRGATAPSSEGVDERPSF